MKKKMNYLETEWPNGFGRLVNQSLSNLDLSKLYGGDGDDDNGEITPPDPPIYIKE